MQWSDLSSIASATGPNSVDLGAPDNAYVSEARVLETTLAILLKRQTRGLTLDPLLSSMVEVVARMKVPLWE